MGHWANEVGVVVVGAVMKQMPPFVPASVWFPSPLRGVKGSLLQVLILFQKKLFHIAIDSVGVSMGGGGVRIFLGYHLELESRRPPSFPVLRRLCSWFSGPQAQIESRQQLSEVSACRRQGVGLLSLHNHVSQFE